MDKRREVEEELRGAVAAPLMNTRRGFNDTERLKYGAVTSFPP